MIELAVILAGLGWVSALVAKNNRDKINQQSANTYFDLLSHADAEDGEEARPNRSKLRNMPLSANTFTQESICGDGVTDETIRKKVVFRADRGTVVQGLVVCVSICEVKLLEWKLGETPNSRGGVLTKQTDYDAILNAGNYTVTVYNYNSTDMPNDGNLTDNQITILIDGFAIGELPMTLSNDSETYPMIVNPD